ncbi:MAG TPA: hypothetical protein VLA15_11140, partial [Desulfurivibrionaceae bacterium]|nr:hypothetical protein [Desulfurivibrionaceae bacterium]
KDTADGILSGSGQTHFALPDIPFAYVTNEIFLILYKNRPPLGKIFFLGTEKSQQRFGSILQFKKTSGEGRSGKTAWDGHFGAG